MKAIQSIKRWNFFLLWTLRIILLMFVIAVLVGIQFPFAHGYKSSFIALIHLGVAVGIVSNWRFIIGLKWNDPINIVGSILGIVATLVIVFAIKEMEAPLVTGYQAAFYALGVLLVIKIGLKVIQDKKDKISDTQA
jgi:peptidoglycan/LPS O-acetylase OafA/YrhL